VRVIKCDCCGNPIKLGDRVYKQFGRCGIYCSGECYSRNYAEIVELTEEVVSDCGAEVIDMDALNELGML